MTLILTHNLIFDSSISAMEFIKQAEMKWPHLVGSKDLAFTWHGRTLVLNHQTYLRVESVGMLESK